MQKRTKKIVEIAFVVAIPKMIKDKIKKGRFRNLCRMLYKTSTKELNKIQLTKAEESTALETIFEFGKRTGWEGKQKNVMTLISFALCLIEESEFEHNAKIISVLNDMYEYLSRRDGVPAGCDWAGQLAVEKMQIIMEG